MTHSNRQLWIQQGYVVFPDFLDRSRRETLRQICDRVLDQIRCEQPAYENITNIAYLTEPKYFRDRLHELITLLEFVADAQILNCLIALVGSEPLFHNTQYFANPIERSWDGVWHRDCQFGAATDAIEQQRMRQITGVHFRVALVDDDQLEYVAGSHDRWDTEAELNIRKYTPECADMPNKTRIALRSGDACLFHAWGIHRGTYRHTMPRRTLDVIYGWGTCDWASPEPTCFGDDTILNQLSDRARRFYQRFIDAYDLNCYRKSN